MDAPYCLSDHKFPSSGQPSTCFYDSKNNWMFVLPEDLGTGVETQTIPLNSKHLDRYSNGSKYIPSDSGPSANLSIVEAALAPNMLVDFYSTDDCSGEAIASAAGTYAQPKGISADQIASVVSVNSPNGTSAIECIKVTKFAQWDEFITSCKNGEISQGQCQQYSSTTDDYTDSGDTETGTPEPDPNRWLVYLLLFGFILALCLMVIVAAIHSPRVTATRPPKIAPQPKSVKITSSPVKSPKVTPQPTRSIDQFVPPSERPPFGSTALVLPMVATIDPDNPRISSRSQFTETKTLKSPPQKLFPAQVSQSNYLPSKSVRFSANNPSTIHVKTPTQPSISSGNKMATAGNYATTF